MPHAQCPMPPLNYIRGIQPKWILEVCGAALVGESAGPLWG